MPNARLPMNHAREILRLSREMKMSGRAIAKSLSLSTSTISKYLRQLELVPWPLPEPGSEALLAKVLEKKKAPAPSARVEPDWDQVHRELQSHKGVTLLLLWEEYRETVQERGYSYSRFCKHYAAYAKRLKPSYRNTYTPGDRLPHRLCREYRPDPGSPNRTGGTGRPDLRRRPGVFELRLFGGHVESGVVLLDRLPCPLLRVPGRSPLPPGSGQS